MNFVKFLSRTSAYARSAKPGKKDENIHKSPRSLAAQEKLWIMHSIRNQEGILHHTLV
jgi:hypothetical protein